MSTVLQDKTDALQRLRDIRDDPSPVITPKQIKDAFADIILLIEK